MAEAGNTRPVVALVKCEDYSRVKAAVHKALGLLGGLERFVLMMRVG